MPKNQSESTNNRPKFGLRIESMNGEPLKREIIKDEFFTLEVIELPRATGVLPRRQ